MGGRSHAPEPLLHISGKAELSPPGLCTCLSFCQSESCSHLLCEERLGAGPEAWGMQGSIGGKGLSAWENTHPHARTCFHSRVCSGPLGQVPGQTDCPDLPSLQGLLPMEGEAYPGDHASLTCASGERGGMGHMLPQGRGVRHGKGAGFLTASQNHPVLSCGQGSLHMNTPLPGSP